MPYGFAMPVTISPWSSYCRECRSLPSWSAGPYPRAALPPRQWAPFEQDRLLARSIARAKFVTLESENHVVVAGEPAWPRLISEIAAFLAE